MKEAKSLDSYSSSGFFGLWVYGAWARSLQSTPSSNWNSSRSSHFFSDLFGLWKVVIYHLSLFCGVDYWQVSGREENVDKHYYRFEKSITTGRHSIILLLYSWNYCFKVLDSCSVTTGRTDGTSRNHRKENNDSPRKRICSMTNFIFVNVPQDTSVSSVSKGLNFSTS